MKKKSKKLFLNMDERNKLIAYKVISIIYFLTIFAMQVVVIYRQFALGQNIDDFQDIAIIMTANSLFLVAALLYFGAVQIRKLNIKTILLVYLIFVILGSLFTYAKYNIFQSPGLSFEHLFDKLIIIVSIIGIILGSWILLSIIAKRRIDKDLE